MKGKGEQRVCKVFDAPNLPEAEAISFFFNKSITTCYSSIMHNFVFLNKKKAHLPEALQMPKTRAGLEEFFMSRYLLIIMHVFFLL